MPKQPSTYARPKFGPKNNKQRMVLSILFILIFLTVGPTLVMYAKGWRFKFNSQETENSWLPSNNVAALNLKTSPRSVNFILKNINGDIIEQNTTPWKTINLEPGLYQLELKQDGYYPLTIPLQLKLHQGLQPGYLNLIQKTYWNDLAVLPEKKINNFDSSKVALETNKKCLLWQYNEEWKRYCNSEEILGNFTFDKELFGAFSKNWYFIIDLKNNNKLQPIYSEEQIIDFNKTENKYIFSLITRSKDMYNAWYIRTNDAGEIIEQQAISSTEKEMYWDNTLQGFISDNKLLRLIF